MALSLISADLVMPMQGEAMLRDAGVVVDAKQGASGAGRIWAVGTVEELHGRFGAIERAHVPGLMLPGLVNAHVHLELGYQRATGAVGKLGDGPLRFTQWVAELMKHYPAAEALEGAVTKAVREGVAESLAAGVTCLGDISRHCGITRRELSGGPLRTVSFGEIVALGKMRGRLPELLQAAADGTYASEFLTIGLSPHAPYTVEGPSLAAISGRAMAQRLPLAMHLAEHSEERAFLADLSGPLGKQWDVMAQMNVLDEAIPLSADGPLRWAQRWGLLGDAGAARKVPVVLAHVNYCDAQEIGLLGRSGASVVYCPRTRAFFGHDQASKHPYREMLAARVNVCLGTDSLASNPDLSVLNEAQLLHRRDHFPALAALEMITWRGAAALGLNAGRLALGAAADVIVMPTQASTHDSPEAVLSRLLIEAPAAAAVWVAGRRVV